MFKKTWTTLFQMSKHFLNELSGTVAVITSDGRMIVVRHLFFNILFTFLKAFHHGNKKNHARILSITCSHLYRVFFKALWPLFYIVQFKLLLVLADQLCPLINLCTLTFYQMTFTVGTHKKMHFFFCSVIWFISKMSSLFSKLFSFRYKTISSI